MIGKTVGKYRIVERLGRGGMGTVYRARDAQTGAPVACASSQFTMALVLDKLPPKPSPCPSGLSRKSRRPANRPSTWKSPVPEP